MPQRVAHARPVAVLRPVRGFGRGSRDRPAFTLAELLVVIGLIGLLIALLMPVLSRVRQAAQATRCASNLRQIGAAMRLYATAYGDCLQTTAGQLGNGVNWIEVSTPAGAPTALRLADPAKSKTAYWGASYLPFIASKALVASEGNDASRIVDFACGIWHCPSSGGISLKYGVDPTHPASYGLNGFIVGQNGTWTNGKSVPFRKLMSYRWPGEVIVAHDAMLPVVGPGATPATLQGGNTLSAWDLKPARNLRDWRPDTGVMVQLGFTADGTREFYRHARRSNVLFLDGHVSPIAESMGDDVPQRWYTGRYN